MNNEKQMKFEIGDWIIANEAFRKTSFGEKRKYRAREIKSLVTDEFGRHDISFMINHMEMLANSKRFRLATVNEIKIEKIKLLFKISSRGLYT